MASYYIEHTQKKDKPWAIHFPFPHIFIFFQPCPTKKKLISIFKGNLIVLSVSFEIKFTLWYMNIFFKYCSLSNFCPCIRILNNIKQNLLNKHCARLQYSNTQYTTHHNTEEREEKYIIWADFTAPCDALNSKHASVVFART